MKQIGEINGRKVIYHNLRQSSADLKETDPLMWIAFFVTGAEDPYFPNAMPLCKRMKTAYIVCSGPNAAECADLYETEAFMGFEPNREAFDVPPPVIAKPGIAEGFNFAVFFATPEEGDCNAVVCFDTSERGVKNYLTALLNEWNEEVNYLTPDAAEEEVSWDV